MPYLILLIVSVLARMALRPVAAAAVASPAPAPQVLAPWVDVGRALLERGLVSADQLESAQAVATKTGEDIGRVLLTQGVVTRRVLFQVIADGRQLPFVDLLADRPDEDLVRGLDHRVMLQEGWVPLRRQAGEVVVAVSSPVDGDRARRISALLGSARLSFQVTTDWDIQQAVREICRGEMADAAANDLAQRTPALSAKSGIAAWQKAALALTALACLVGAILWPRDLVSVVFVILSVGFSVSIAFKFIVGVVGLDQIHRRGRRGRNDGLEVIEGSAERIPDDELPVFTILVPVFREANIVAGLMDHLGALDYPKEKLEILLLMEEEDTETIEAARAAHPPEMIRFVIIPPGDPQTKPRACNVGLAIARGEFLVIYDAEDLPDKGQLRQAVAAFREAGEDTICLQARLNYFNANENFLTRMFTLEYSQWFDYMLPGLDRLRLPLPLGGTSNHFRTAALRQLAGWDAWNVTEDADLGLRAAALGMRVGIIESTTYEEACSRFRPWVKQRTRWIKGYMVTALVHTRNPFQMVRRAGLRSYLTLLFLIGGTPLSSLAAPVVWILSLGWLVDAFLDYQLLNPVPDWIELVALLNLLAG